MDNKNKNNRTDINVERAEKASERIAIGDYDGAIKIFQKIIERSRLDGDTFAEALVLCHQGNMFRDHINTVKAEACY